MIASDESGVGGATHYGFGSLWMPWERRGDFQEAVREIRKRHRMPDAFEIKWSNLDGHVRRAVALDLIDWFFRRPWLSFHCVVVQKATVDKTLHGGSYDLARRKHFVMLLTRKMVRCAAAHADRTNTFRVWVDPIASSYKKADEAAHVIAARELRQLFDEERAQVENLQVHDSRETPSIQLCDLLLGAVMDAWQGKATKAEKVDVAHHIAERLGWPDLRADTYPGERKFNIWHFFDTKGPRLAETRRVTLMYPLPAQRRRPQVPAWPR